MSPGKKNRDGRTSCCRACLAVRHLAYGGAREYHLRQRYGITTADDDALVAAQGGTCPLCRERPPAHVDHDHVTGQVRGVLCSGGKQGLGNVPDEVRALRLAAACVERPSWQRRKEAPGAFRLRAPLGPPQHRDGQGLEGVLGRGR